MTIIKKVWKVDWYKNNTKECGAQDEAIGACPEGNIVIHSKTKKEGKLWGCIEPNKLLKLIEKNHGIYEVLSKFPHKAYFDIDKDEKDLELLNKIKSIILKYFPNAEMAVSGSITDKKTSYHIVLQNYVIHNAEEREYMKNLAIYLKKHEDDSIDTKVYTKNRNMKCINQSKEDDARVQEIVEMDNYKAHLITCFIDSLSLPFQPLPEEVCEEVLIEKSKKPFNLGSLPKLVLKTPKDFDNVNATPKEILEITPLVAENDFAYIHFVARFCYTNDISFDDYLSWLKNRNPNIEKNAEGMRKWDSLHKFPPVTTNQMISFLQHFYPNLRKDIHYRNFVDSFILPENHIKKIETINQDCYNSPQKYSILNVGMGGGKTAQTIDYLGAKDLRTIWITPNIALAENTTKRFEDKKIKVDLYNKVSTKDKKAGKLNDSKMLIICLNSLHYVETDDERRILVIDEIETLLNKFMGDFMGENKNPIWHTFVKIFREADKVILLDAFITTKTINFIKSVEGKGFEDYVIYERILEPQTRTINYLNNENAMLKDIIEKIKSGSKVFIFYPYKKGNNIVSSMSTIYEAIKEATGVDGEYYHAEVSDKTKKSLKDVNNAWGDKRFIITNNIITCGVNYENLDFDYKYLFVASHNSPRDIIQVSYRARHLNSGIIKVCYMGKMTPNTTWLNDCDEMECKIYKSLYHSILVELKAPIRRCFQLFCVKAHYKQVEEEYQVNEAVDKEIRDLLDKHNLCVRYENIETINGVDAEYIQSKCFAQEATMMEKFQLNKYYFKKSFLDTADEQILADIWNDKYNFFFRKIGEVLRDDNNLFNKIAEENKLTQLFPEGVKKLKYSEETLKRIFKEFTFKYITEKSSAHKITKEIYNTYFNMFIIIVKYDENKHASYTMDDNCKTYYDFAKEYLVLDQYTYMTYRTMKQSEDESCIEV